MQVRQLGKMAAAKQANRLAAIGSALGGRLGSGLAGAGGWLARKPIKRGLPAAAGSYALGEGAVSAMQGGESLGKQWDQSITRGQVEGGNLGGVKAYLGRLLTRPASTMYGTVNPYQKPDIKWQKSPGTPGTARQSSDGSYTRFVEQRAKLPYWLQLQQKQLEQAGKRQAEAYRDASQELRQALSGDYRYGIDAAEQGRQAAQNRLGESLQEQGLPAKTPEYRPSREQQQYEQIQRILSGESPDRGGGRNETAATPKQDPVDVAKTLFGAGLPMASLYSASRQQPKSEEERLQEAMRMYRMGR